MHRMMMAAFEKHLASSEDKANPVLIQAAQPSR